MFIETIELDPADQNYSTWGSLSSKTSIKELENRNAVDQVAIVEHMVRTDLTASTRSGRGDGDSAEWIMHPERDCTV